MNGEAYYHEKPIVYVLKSRTMRCLKIGRTQDMNTRLKQLNSQTAGPGDWKVIAFYESDNVVNEEAKLYAFFGSRRVLSNREFFTLNVVNAIMFSNQVLKRLPDYELYAVVVNADLRVVRADKATFRDKLEPYNKALIKRAVRHHRGGNRQYRNKAKRAQIRMRRKEKYRICAQGDKNGSNLSALYSDVCPTRIPRRRLSAALGLLSSTPQENV